jgi:hypothetical protein
MFYASNRFPAIPRVLALSLILLPLTTTHLARADGNQDEGWTLTKTTIPLTELQVNTCNGEDVPVAGMGTMVTRTKLQPDGTTSIKVAVSIYATGTGSISGAAYTLKDHMVQNVFGVASLPFSFNTMRTAKLVGDGVPDMYLHSVVKVTIDIDGTIKQDFTNVHIDCNP